MATLPPVAAHASVNTTGQLAQQMPAYDPGPVIAAHEQNLQDYLNLPVQEILARLGLAPATNGQPGQDDAPPPAAQHGTAQPPAPPVDPSTLISPVTDALGTLGSGLFQGNDPTQVLQGISQAFQSTAPALRQAMGSLDDVWQGASGTAAGAKTATAIANGAEVGAQSDALRPSLATAAADVGQARARVVEIIAEFAATLAAIGPNIIFPWGWAAAIAAANKAIAQTAEVMTDTQSSLGAQAAAVTAAGAPVDVAAMPQLGASPIASSASQLIPMIASAAEAGIQAGTGAASAAGQSASQPPTESDTDAPLRDGGDLVPAGAPVGGPVSGGGFAGGAGGTLSSRTIPNSQMLQQETPTTTAPTLTRAASTAVPAMSATPMSGGPYAPMAGQGANASSNNHNAAQFLHTTERGGEIVGDLGTAAPPVLGEADPSEPPDLELHI